MKERKCSKRRKRRSPEVQLTDNKCHLICCVLGVRSSERLKLKRVKVVKVEENDEEVAVKRG